MLDIWLIWASFMLTVGVFYYTYAPIWALIIVLVISVAFAVIAWKRLDDTDDDELF